MAYNIFFTKIKKLASQLQHNKQLHGKQQKIIIYQQAPEVKSNL